MKHCLILVLLFAAALGAISTENFSWLLATENFDVLRKHSGKVEELICGPETEVRLALEFALRTQEPELELLCRERLALGHHSLADALEWLRLADQIKIDNAAFEKVRQQLVEEFTSPDEQIVLDHYLYGTSDEDFLHELRHVRGYNPVIESLAREMIDRISVESSDSLALALIDTFERDYPLSE